MKDMNNVDNIYTNQELAYILMTYSLLLIKDCTSFDIM